MLPNRSLCFTILGAFYIRSAAPHWGSTLVTRRADKYAASRVFPNRKISLRNDLVSSLEHAQAFSRSGNPHTVFARQVKIVQIHHASPHVCLNREATVFALPLRGFHRLCRTRKGVAASVYRSAQEESIRSRVISDKSRLHKITDGVWIGAPRE